MVSRIVIVGAIIAAMLLSLGPFSVPNWTVVALLVVLFSTSVVLGLKRMRVEGRLAREIWQAMTRK
jgi:hypothetical protein